jgi:hypothetical protein
MPLITLISADKVNEITGRKAIVSRSSVPMGFPTHAPTARMAFPGGLLIALNGLLPYIPLLEIELDMFSHQSHPVRTWPAVPWNCCFQMSKEWCDHTHPPVWERSTGTPLSLRNSFLSIKCFIVFLPVMSQLFQKNLSTWWFSSDLAPRETLLIFHI